MENPEVKALLTTNGKKILPITLVNGKVFKTGQYPSYEELCEILNLKPLYHKPITVKIS